VPALLLSPCYIKIGDHSYFEKEEAGGRKTANNDRNFVVLALKIISVRGHPVSKESPQLPEIDKSHFY
jgi:hypothetical protein